MYNRCVLIYCTPDTAWPASRGVHDANTELHLNFRALYRCTYMCVYMQCTHAYTCV